MLLLEVTCLATDEAQPLPPEIIRAIQVELGPELIVGSPRTEEVQKLPNIRIDLNSDGRPEFIVQATQEYCGSGGCSLWVYEVFPGGARRIGECRLGSIGGVAVLNSGSGGYHDILVRNELANGKVYFHILVFDGGRYVEHESTGILFPW